MKKESFENKFKEKLYDYIPDTEIPECNFLQSLNSSSNINSVAPDTKKYYINKFCCNDNY